jgi:phage-related tail fiber protein
MSSNANRFVSKNGLDGNSISITNVADPVNPQDVATKNFASNAANITTGTLPGSVQPARTGDVTSPAGSTVNTLANSGVTAGTYTKITVDAKGRATVGASLASGDVTTALGFTPLSNAGGTVSGTITLTSGTVTGLATPSASTDATTKSYVDTAITNAINGFAWKQEAAVTTTANITLSGTQTIDGYAVQVGDRVLVKNQTNATQNGVYIAASGAWSRASDVATGAEIFGMAILVLNGTQYNLTQWVNTNTTAPTLGSTNITYAQLQGAGIVYAAGTGLTLTGSTFSITNTGVTASTYTKVTVNAQGQVTSGTSLSSGDVTTALGFTPYNATNPSGYISANQTITLSGDVTGSGTTAITATLANSGVSAGTYTKVTVNAKGLVTTGASLASGDVTTALGYTPYNPATNALSFSNGQISSNSLVTSTNTAGQVVDSFAVASYRSAEYTIQVTSGSAYQALKIMVLHDGTTPSILEYGDQYTGSSLSTFDATITGGNLNLTVTPVNNATTIKVMRIAVSV